MYLDVYIASTEVPGFSWGESPRDNIYFAVEPKAISEILPESYEAFFLRTDKIDEGFYTYKKIDWGTWAAKVSKQQIIDFCKELYGKYFMTPKRGYNAIREKKLKINPYDKSLKGDISLMSSLIATIIGLEEGKDYALLGIES